MPPGRRRTRLEGFVNAPQLLAALIPGLYVLDCLRLLQPGQVVLRTRGRGDWRAGLGFTGWQLAGREPWIANPFLPDEILIVRAWRGDEPGRGATGEDDAGGGSAGKDGAVRKSAGKKGAGKKGAGRIDAGADTGVEATPCAQLRRAQAALLPVGRLAWLSWVLALVVLPVSLLAGLGPVVVIGAVLALYANILLCIVLLARRREQIGLDRAAVGRIAAECLACAPYGVLIARKALEALPAQGTLPGLADLLEADNRAEVWEQCRARLRLAQAEFDAGTPGYDAVGSELQLWEPSK